VLKFSDEERILEVKNQIAWKGMYIPVVDLEGNSLLSVEDFEERLAVLNTLKRLGYPYEIARDVYDYYSKRHELSDKHKFVLEKAVQAMKEGMKVDLAVLVETMKDDSLNYHDDAWYRDSSFEDIYTFFVKDRTRLAQKEVRERLFEGEQAQAIYLREFQNLDSPQGLRQKYHAHMQAFMDKQVATTALKKEDVNKVLVTTMMRPINPAKLEDAADLVTEVKKEMLVAGLKEAWSVVFERIDEVGLDRAKIEEIQQVLVPVMSGSLGRGEAVLGSDLDFLFLFDDEENPDIAMEDMKRIVDEFLTPALETFLKKMGIRPDAGLARSGRNPFVTMSEIKTFEIDMSQSRQTEEPTELLDMRALTIEDEELVRKAKRVLFIDNMQVRNILTTYIERDLEVGSGKKSFIQQFEFLYLDFAKGMDLSKIKESMQRVSTFKIYDMISRAFSPEFGVPLEEAESIPSTLPDKLDWLESHGIISVKEKEIWERTIAVSYKLRMMSEFFSEESKTKADDDIPRKVKSTALQKKMLSFRDRQYIFEAMRDFREYVLYK